MIGVDASFANALRRIIISEVPTMAIEKVYVFNNTSIMQDEVLAHRLGLIPLNVDPRLFDCKTASSEDTDVNTIVLEMKVKCEKKGDTLLHSNVYASDLKFIPKGSQSPDLFPNQQVSVVPDILIAKLRPGQEIHVELHCEKNVGKEHAKWSPVGTASYRLMPEIEILEPIVDELAERFVKCFPVGVAAVNVIKGVKTAVVVDPRKDTVSREVLRDPELASKVRLARIRDHFIFSVESVGQLKPEEIVIEALKVLMKKCVVVKEAIKSQ